MGKIVKSSKLNRLWKNGILPFKNKVDNPISSYEDMMANTVAGYMLDPLAAKGGFIDTNSKFDSVNDRFIEVGNSIRTVNDKLNISSIRQVKHAVLEDKNYIDTGYVKNDTTIYIFRVWINTPRLALYKSIDAGHSYTTIWDRVIS